MLLIQPECQIRRGWHAVQLFDVGRNLLAAYAMWWSARRLTASIR